MLHFPVSNLPKVGSPHLCEGPGGFDATEDRHVVRSPRPPRLVRSTVERRRFRVAEVSEHWLRHWLLQFFGG